MRLTELAARLVEADLEGDGSIEVSGISHDSRRVARGEIFAAMPGRSCHGLDHLEQAVGRGAAAVLTDRPRPSGHELPWLVVREPRRDMARAAWILAGDPQRNLDIVAVTGTNGKSTVAHLVQQILVAAGRPTAFFGTVGYRLPDGRVEPAARTTPEATDLARLMRTTLDAGGRAVAMEVSSHALVMDRLAGLEVDVAVWTNLTRDHLDEHGDMESYFQVKRRLFTDHLAAEGRRVLGLDDPFGARLLDERREGDLSWGLDRGDVHASDAVSDLDGTRFQLVLAEESTPVSLRLLGVHNLRNALAAAAATWVLGVDPSTIAVGLGGAEPLPGRLERIPVDRPFPAFVDYAHTPEGLRAVLQSLRRLGDRRLVVVFGAGGDRDPGKRGPMGFAVGELADVAVVTSDNPRSEDPAAIAAAVADGVRAAGSDPVVILDRREAIAHALAVADPRSLVLVAGKGHEATQTIGSRVLHFSDHEVLRELAGGVSCG